MNQLADQVHEGNCKRVNGTRQPWVAQARLQLARRWISASMQYDVRPILHVYMAPDNTHTVEVRRRMETTSTCIHDQLRSVLSVPATAQLQQHTTVFSEDRLKLPQQMGCDTQYNKVIRAHAVHTCEADMQTSQA